MRINGRDVRQAMKLNSLSYQICLLLVLLLLQTGALGQTPNEQVRSITSALGVREFEKALELLQIEYEAGSKDAIPLLERVLKIRPNDVTSHAMMAVMAGKNGDCTTAVKHFSKSEPMLDSQPEALQGYGVCLLKLKQTDEAIRVFKQLMTSQPNDARCRRALVAVQLSAERPQDALTTMQPLLASEPDVSTMRLAAAVYEANVQLADYEKAESDFEKAEQLDPAQGMSAAAQGMLAEEKNQNDPDQALATVRAKLAKNPDDAFLLYLQAAILSKKSAEPGSLEFEKGFDSAKRAVSLQPSLTAAHNVLAKYYLDSGQNALAAKECRLVLQQNSSDQSALYHLVIALRKMESPAEIPDLLKKLAKARQDATREEGDRNRYKLVVAPAGSSD